MADATARAVIVDDEPAARDVVRSMLADHPAVQVVGEAKLSVYPGTLPKGKTERIITGSFIPVSGPPVTTL